MIETQPSSSKTQSQLLDAAALAVNRLSHLSKRRVDTAQLPTFLEEVKAAHFEVVKHGSRNQKSTVLDFEENGTRAFGWAIRKSRHAQRNIFSTLNS